MLKQGDKIGEYVLINKVGSGGFGDVWKAEKRTALDANYFALKFYRPKDDRLDLDKIGREIKVWKQLKGLPHIISVTELDQFEDYVYVVSDFAEGGSLENWLQANGKASSQEEAVKITLQLLTGLENLHEKGFVHRDLKPDNILIMNGRYCLADFGISREIKTHSKATGTAGTMEYMPPEAFEKTPSVTPQTDIWAVGVILQKLLTGALPYPQGDYPSLVSAILMYEPEPMPASVPEDLREIVKKALQKDRKTRFQTAREMREALKNPSMFSAERAKKVKDSKTIVDEDFGKTELLEIPITKDWRETETKEQYQREEEQAKLEKERLELEKEEQQRLEREKLQREAETKRIQRESEETLRKQKEAKDILQRQQDEERRRRETEARILQKKDIRNDWGLLQWIVFYLTKTLKKNKNIRNFIIGIGGFIALISIGIWMNGWKTSDIPANVNYSNTNLQVAKEIDTPPLPRQISQPPNTIYFEFTKQYFENRKGGFDIELAKHIELGRNFLGFSLYYPNSWTINSSPSSFLDVSKKSADGLPIKQVIITRYESKGLFSQDKADFAKFAEQSNKALKKIVPNYRLVSEGETTIQDGRWKAYEMKFENSSTIAKNGILTLCGRKLWIPIQRPGMKNGFTITLIATSLAPKVKSVEDLLMDEELTQILETFEPLQ